MSIYTDSDILTAADLVDLDSEVLEVAAAGNTPVSIDDKIREAWDECADTLLAHMQSFGGVVNMLVGAGVQMATLLTNYGMGVSRSRIWLSQVVVDEPYANRMSPLKRWMAYQALAMFYRDAAERVAHDRYDLKRERYEKDGARAWGRCQGRGLPVVLQPLPAPGSIHEFNSGTWGTSNVSSVVSGGATGGTFVVVVTWVDSSKYSSSTSKGNGESGPSGLATPAAVTAGHALHIDITSLVPPNGRPYQSGTFANGILAMLTATHWNVYAGPLGSTLTLQNANPIPVATKTYTLAGDPTSTGAVLAPGQMPDANYAFLNVLQRA